MKEDKKDKKGKKDKQDKKDKKRQKGQKYVWESSSNLLALLNDYNDSFDVFVFSIF